MPETIELRVHGVGGSTPEGLLGEGSEAALARVAGEGATAFYARRRDPHVEGYVWGRLTSGGLVQPIWLMLLPFTLVNVAGWMHAPHEDLRGRWGRLVWVVYRAAALQVVALSLTALYVFWSARSLVNFAYRRDAFLWLEGARAKVLAASSLLAIGLLLLLVVVGLTQRRFEAVGEETGGSSPDAGGGRRSRRRVRPLRFLADLYRSAVTLDSLESQVFYRRSEEARRLLWVHFTVAVGSLGAAAGWAWHQADRGLNHLPLGRFVTYTTWVMLWAVVALAVLHVAGWRSPFRSDVFRFLGPGVAAGAGLGLATAFFHGVSIAFDRGNPDSLVSMGSAIACAIFAVAFGALGLAAWIGWGWKAEVRAATDPARPEFIPRNSADRGAEPNGASGALIRRAALMRVLARVGGHADLILTLAVAVFVASALVQLYVQAWDFPLFISIGNWVAAGGAVVLLGFLLRRSWRPGERRLVGILWDVLTYWPRRFHPFAVRPYAERAVPELWDRIRHHTSHGRQIVLWGHSQGTVLAYTALLQGAIPSPDGLLPSDATKSVALVTCGSPLRTLYQMAFPAYFGPKGFLGLRGCLFGGAGAPEAWRNFFRLTDYIGREVFADPRLDQPVPDPARHPATTDAPLGAPFWAGADPPRPVWTELALHSFYFREPEMKEWVRTVRGRMGEPHEVATARGRRVTLPRDVERRTPSR